MNPIRVLAVTGVVVLAATLGLAAQRVQQPSLNFGAANISLGMTLQEAQNLLTGAGQHIHFIPDEKPPVRTAMIDEDDYYGQVTFWDGRVVFVKYQMPVAHNPDELAQEIAGAVDSMETKTCSASNYSSHGTGGGFSESIFQCGPKRFSVTTTQVLRSGVRDINVSIQIGHIGPN